MEAINDADRCACPDMQTLQLAASRFYRIVVAIRRFVDCISAGHLGYPTCPQCLVDLDRPMPARPDRATVTSPAG
jgi:hypothetical protein